MVRDRDYRLPPDYTLKATVQAKALDLETRMEQFEVVPGRFLVQSAQGGGTPVADDRGMYRSDERHAERLAQKRMEAIRENATVVSFETNALDLLGGLGITVFGVAAGLDLAEMVSSCQAPEFRAVALQHQRGSVAKGMTRLGICGAVVVDTIPTRPLPAWGALLRVQAVFAVPSHADKAIRRPQNAILIRFARMHECYWASTGNLRTLHSIAQLSWGTIRVGVLA